MVMPNQPPISPTEFPKFPSLFTTEDVQRKKELEEQKRRMETVYQTKFTDEAQAKMSLPEKALRTGISGTPLATLAKIVSPWQWGFDYGMLPEEARKEKEDILFEIADLSRREQVSTFVPAIQNTLRALALTSKSLLTDPKDLTSYFHLKELGFNEEEIQWVSEYAYRVSSASPEDVLTGEGIGLSPITEREMDLLRKTPGRDARFILSTVAFSRNQEAISNALREAYPSQVEEELSYRDRVIGEYAKFYEDITGKKLDTELGTESIKEAFTKIAREVGKPIVLADNSTGNVIIGKVKEDFTITVIDQLTGEEYPIGSYDEKNDRVVPTTFAGTPATTVQEQESVIKDWWDSAFLSLSQSWYTTRQFVLNTIPKYLQLRQGISLEEMEKRHPGYIAEARARDPELFAQYERKQQEVNKAFQEDFERREAEYYAQLEETKKTHPEFAPRPEWEEPIFDRLKRSPREVLDVGYLGNILARNINTYLAVGATIGTFALTRNPWTTAAVGGTLFTPLETESLKTDLLESGATYEQAVELAVPAGIFISSLEYVGNYPLLKSLAPQFFGEFKKNLQKDLVKGIMKKVLQVGVTVPLKVIAGETLEEVGQEIAHNAFVKTVDENRSLLENIPETFLQTIVTTIPLGVLGGGSEYIRMRSNLPEKVQTKLVEDSQKLQESGFTEQQADIATYSNLVETEIGQAQVEEAVIQAKETLPPGERDIYLQGRIADYNDELENTRNSIKVQQDRVVKMRASGELPSDIAEKVSLIKEMQARLVEIEKDREHYQKELTKSKREIPVTEETLQVEETPTATVDPRIQERLDIVNKALAKDPTNEALLALKEKLGVKEVTQKPSQTEEGGIIPPNEQEALDDDELAIEEGDEQSSLREQEALEEAESLSTKEPMDKDTVADTLKQIGKEALKAKKTLRSLIPDLTMFPGESLPRLPDLEVELANTKVAFSNPVIRAKIRGGFFGEKLHNEAKDLVDSLHTMYESLQDKDEKKKVMETLKNIARKADIRIKTLLTTNWDNLEPVDQRKLATSLLKAGSLDLDITRWFKDSRYVFAEMEKKSALPFFTIYQRTRRVHGYILRVKDEYLKRIINNPIFKDIVRDVKLQARVAQLINSKDPNSGVVEPDNITDAERLCAFEISQILDEWKPIVRFLRFTEAFEESGTSEHIQSEIKDAPPEDIDEALKIYTTEGEDALWSYLGDKSWGVLDTGFDPRRVLDPSLQIKEPPSTTTRGARHLMSRQFLEAPAGYEKDLFRRFDTYNGSMAIRWFMRKEITALDEYFRASASKWSDPEAIKSYLTGYIKEIQGFPQESSVFTWMVREVQKVVYPIIFMRPVLGFRNVLQPLWSFPYRKELFSSLLTGLRNGISPSLSRIGEVYFATSIDQSGRPMREFLFQDSESSFPGKLPTWLKVGLFLPKYAIAKPLGLLSNLAARVPTMSISDKASRSWAFWTILRRTNRANEQYLPGEDMSKWNLDKWIAHSGMRELTFEQQNYILGLLGHKDEISWAVSGLQHLSGKEAAALQIATDIVEKTLYMYDRSASSQAHWGESGRAYGSLLIFPRSTVQMFALEIDKVFNTESKPIERIAATKNIILLYLAGEMLSRFLVLATGRERKDYSLVNMFTWELGGLSYSIARDVSTLVSDLAIAAFGTSEDRTIVWDKLPTELTQLGDVGVGFYSIALDALEVALNEEKGLDKRWIRKVRAWFDAKYKPEELEKAELTVVQKFQKILAGANPPELDVFQNAQRELIRVEDKLGERELDGTIYTTRQLSGSIRGVLANVDSFLVSEDNGFSDLVLFHEEASDFKKLYDALPSEPSSIRENWRKEHLEEEAMFLFWGWSSKSVFTEGSKEGKEIMKLLNFWWETLNISREMRPDAIWVDLKPIPLTGRE